MRTIDGYGVLEGPQYFNRVGRGTTVLIGPVFGSLFGTVWTDGISESLSRPQKQAFFYISAIADEFLRWRQFHPNCNHSKTNLILGFISSTAI